MSLDYQTNKECDNCGAEYTVRYDDEQFGISSIDPTFCPFCGSEISVIDDQQFEELDFEDD